MPTSWWRRHDTPSPARPSRQRLGIWTRVGEPLCVRLSIPFLQRGAAFDSIPCSLNIVGQRNTLNRHRAYQLTYLVALVEFNARGHAALQAGGTWPLQSTRRRAVSRGVPRSAVWTGGGLWHCLWRDVPPAAMNAKRDVPPEAMPAAMPSPATPPHHHAKRASPRRRRRCGRPTTKFERGGGACARDPRHRSRGAAGRCRCRRRRCRRCRCRRRRCRRPAAPCN